MLTWYSTILPFSTQTRCSLIHALRTFPQRLGRTGEAPLNRVLEALLGGGADLGDLGDRHGMLRKWMGWRRAAL